MNVNAAIKKKINALSEYQSFMNKFIQEIILENEAVIIELNAEEQLYEKGINTFGVSISDYQAYTEVTIGFKKLKGQPTNRVTLRDEGDFHDSFSIILTNTYFEIIASDPKTEKLKKKYGPILGLTDENILEISHNYILPELRKILIKYLNR